MSDDVILCASLDRVTSVVGDLEWPDPSYMYLERLPDVWLDEAGRQDGLRFETLELTTLFNNWERGRIFCKLFELRWEKMDGEFQLVYIGPPIELTGFEPASQQEIDLANTSSQSHSYFLWGSRLDDKKLKTVGASKEPGAEIFVEMRVPRLLKYPVSDQAERVKLTACEYTNPNTGDIVYYRFQGLEEV
jgi:hypothetical protein